jgi:hypothetical protein
MPSERHDHFAGMRQQEAPARVRDPSAPAVSPDLVEHLEKAFRRSPPGVAASQDDLVAFVTLEAQERGRLDVIDYLRSLLHDAPVSASKPLEGA